jgi:hypothetical protein
MMTGMMNWNMTRAMSSRRKGVHPGQNFLHQSLRTYFEITPFPRSTRSTTLAASWIHWIDSTPGAIILKLWWLAAREIKNDQANQHEPGKGVWQFEKQKRDGGGHRDLYTGRREAALSGEHSEPGKNRATARGVCLKAGWGWGRLTRISTELIAKVD